MLNSLDKRQQKQKQKQKEKQNGCKQHSDAIADQQTSGKVSDNDFNSKELVNHPYQTGKNWSESQKINDLVPHKSNGTVTW